MKKLLIGKMGVGKTTLIVKKIIPALEKYLVLDFYQEYPKLLLDKTKIHQFERGLIGNKLRDQSIDIIRSTNDDTTLIIDNTNLLYFPKQGGWNQHGDGGFLWLKKELKNKKYVLVFQSIQSVTKGDVPDIFDDIYYFPTRDSDSERTSYLALQMAEKKNVILMDGYQTKTF